MKLRYLLILVIVLAGVLVFAQRGMDKGKDETAKVEEVAKDASTEEGKQTPAPFNIACKYLSEMLAKCEPYTCEMQHPSEKGFTVKHTVAGQLPNGLCVHLQTAPKDMLVVCNYSEGMRVLVAKNLRVEKKEKMSQGESKILSAAFDAECEVINTKTGAAIKRARDGNDLQRGPAAAKTEDKSTEGTTDKQ